MERTHPALRDCHGNNVAASRQSAANCAGNSDGGFLPKAATPQAGVDARGVGRGADDAGADWSRRLVTAMLGEDGNLMKADGNSFPEFILGWTIGKNSD